MSFEWKDGPRAIHLGRRPELLIHLGGAGLILSLFLLSYLQIDAHAVKVKLGGFDPLYYFGTARSLLFDHDFDLRNEFALLRPMISTAGGFVGVNGLPGSPYALGYSFLSIPFLAAGTAIDALAGEPADGYGRFALLCYFSANVVFVWAGLIFLTRFLRAVGAPLWIAVLSSTSLWFGTTLGYFTISPMAHAATFMATSAFLFLWWRVKDSTSTLAWAGLGLCGGFAALCRWQDVLFVMAPVLYEFMKRRGRSLPWAGWVAYGVAVFVVLIPQFVQWKILYGTFLTVPQGSGFMEFPPRFILNVLFSTNHGWFIWTPLTLIGVLGLIYGASRAPVTYLPWIAVVAAEVSVIGSMPYNWNCADGFGIRSLTSCVPLIAWGLVILWMDLAPRKRVFLAVAAACCLAYTSLFVVQYRLDLVPRRDTLTARQLLWDKVFLRQAYLERKARLHSPFRADYE